MTHRPGAISALIAAAAFTLVGAAFLTDREPPPVYQTITPSQSSGFSFSWGSGRVNDLVGTTVTVHTEAVPAEFVGVDCDVSGTTNATESVHPGNVLHVRTNGTTIDVLDVENVALQELSFSGSGELAESIIFDVTLGDGDASPNRQTTSISGTVSVSCLLPPPSTEPTTTTPSTTSPTTAPVSTTTAPSTSTVPPPSSTVPEPPTTSTSVPPTPPPSTSPPTSAPETSSTGSDRCPPGSYSIGNGACAAVEESG